MHICTQKEIRTHTTRHARMMTGEDTSRKNFSESPYIIWNIPGIASSHNIRKYIARAGLTKRHADGSWIPCNTIAVVLQAVQHCLVYWKEYLTAASLDGTLPGCKRA